MSESMYKRLPDETDDQYLLRLGGLKENQEIELTWPEMALVLNAVCKNGPKSESGWRKRYKELSLLELLPKDIAPKAMEDYAEEPEEE